MTVQRYDRDCVDGMQPCADGDWVRHDDHVAAMTEAYRDGAAWGFHVVRNRMAGAEAMREVCGVTAIIAQRDAAVQRAEKAEQERDAARALIAAVKETP